MLLLNAVLTVRAHQAGSHAKKVSAAGLAGQEEGWEGGEGASWQGACYILLSGAAFAVRAKWPDSAVGAAAACQFLQCFLSALGVLALHMSSQLC